MNWDAAKPYFTAAVRWALGLAAGDLAHMGWISTSQQTQLIDIGTGVALGAGALAWSWWQKHHQQKAVAAASAGALVKT